MCPEKLRNPNEMQHNTIRKAILTNTNNNIFPSDSWTFTKTLNRNFLLHLMFKIRNKILFSYTVDFYEQKKGRLHQTNQPLKWNNSQFSHFQSKKKNNGKLSIRFRYAWPFDSIIMLNMIILGCTFEPLIHFSIIK